MSEAKQSIWILEDDAGSRFVYDEILGSRYDISFSASLAEFRQRISKKDRSPDLMITDLKLSDGSFLQYLGAQGKKDLPCPFIVISSIDDIDSLNICFTEGAVDYLTKPFARAELQVKVEKALRSPTPISPLSSPDLKLEPTSLMLERNGLKTAPLTPKEIQIVAVLMRAKDQTLVRNDLVRQVWGEIRVSSKTFDVHLFNLRKKLQCIAIEIVHQAPHSYRLIRR